jgi:ribosomal protein S18 acetylase RimI-like enzyme
MTISIRTSRSDEIENIHQHIPEFDPYYIVKNSKRKDIDNKNPCYIIGYSDSKAVGYCVAYDTPDSMYIWLIGVLPAFRRHGIFTALMDAILNEAHARGHSKVSVKTYPHFESMVAALTKQGFIQSKEDSVTTALYLYKNIS